MSLLASFFWEKENNQISYMVLDDSAYKILTKPQRIHIPINNYKKEIDKTINNFVDEINKLKSQCNSTKVNVEYKTVIRRYRKAKPNPESVYVHDELTKRLDDEGFSHKRRASKLKNKELRLFKAVLQNIGVLEANDDAYIHHLWCIALHATKKTYRSAIKKLWKRKNGIQRMNNENKKEFKLFSNQIRESML